MIESLLIKSGLFLQLLSFEDIISKWDQAGVFSVLLPFLLIFAIIYGILGSTKVLGDNRGVSVIISAVIGLFVVRIEGIATFMVTLFSGLGVGLSVLLMILLLTGLFLGPKNLDSWFNGYIGIGLLIAAIIVISSLNQYAWFGSIWWQDNWKIIVWSIVIVLVVAGFMNFDKNKTRPDWGALEPLRTMVSSGGSGDGK
jgi:hypothetical protein